MTLHTTFVTLFIPEPACLESVFGSVLAFATITAGGFAFAEGLLASCPSHLIGLHVCLPGVGRLPLEGVLPRLDCLGDLHKAFEVWVIFPTELCLERLQMAALNGLVGQQVCGLDVLELSLLKELLELIQKLRGLLALLLLIGEKVLPSPLQWVLPSEDLVQCLVA